MPPLSLTTVLTSFSCAAWSLLVMVQVAVDREDELVGGGEGACGAGPGPGRVPGPGCFGQGVESLSAPPGPVRVAERVKSVCGAAVVVGHGFDCSFRCALWRVKGCAGDGVAVLPTGGHHADQHARWQYDGWRVTPPRVPSPVRPLEFSPQASTDPLTRNANDWVLLAAT